ncbi:hypothetical protein OOK13_43200 [Streptomyces sp. NBC_00378]|uniref:hypothetical protein n=1 Tax=unclassified Streptomyces TaxID=2593676 RepID=UPI002259EEA3|nr:MULTISPECIES: hypothetical protein [unclassified Streptomyces]MCX5115137.1 hypothetical protein [Streptomyces sp. NBC_00378]
MATRTLIKALQELLTGQFEAENAASANGICTDPSVVAGYFDFNFAYASVAFARLSNEVT